VGRFGDDERNDGQQHDVFNMTIEIPQNCWIKFCEKAGHSGDTLMDIRVQDEGDMRLLAQAALLRSLTYEAGDAGNSTLVVEFGNSAQESRRYCVIEPSRLTLRQQSNGDRFDQLELPSESGNVTISFQPGISPALLAGLDIRQN
jgi:hypothetical protein